MTDQSPPSIQIAPLWRRFAALGYDVFVLGGVSMGYGATITAVSAAIEGGQQQDYTPMLHGPGVFIGWVLVILAFYCGFWLKSGQTIGMRAWNIRLISTVHTTNPTEFTHPNLQQTLLRSAAGIPGLLCLGAAYWFRWFNKQGDCWHDMISATRVVITSRQK